MQSLSSVDSMKMDNKESLFTAHCALEGQEKENSEV